ncbi:MAG: MFS transporter [Chloroflexi bacterium]|nr:MFS transporter [Chloroflexota bacterium]
MDSESQSYASVPQQATGEVAREAQEYRVLPKRQVVLIMGGVMLAMFLAALDQTVVATAIPRIVADLGGFDKFTWITSAYLVASTTAVPIVGRLSDMYGRKAFFIGGIIVFLVGSVLAGFAQTMNQLIAFRAIQGLGGGAIMANAFISIGDLAPPAERGKFQGGLAAVFGLSSVIGPTLGGFITDSLSWHWIFFINLPLGIPVVFLFFRLFPQIKGEEGKHRIDYVGMVSLVLAVVSLLLALSWGGVQYAWASPQVVSALAVAAVTTAVFIVVELRVAEPIMPLTIYRNSVVSLSLFITFVTGFGMFGAIVFVPLFFQGVLGASATSSGSFLTPMMLGVVFGAAISGQLLSRTGGHYRIQGLIGVAIMLVGLFLMSQMSESTSNAQAIANIVIMGFGLGNTFPVFLIAVQNAVPYNVMGAATSATQFFRSIGGTLGLAVLGAFMTTRFESYLSGALSPALKEAIPPEQLARISDNPQALVNPAALEALRAQLAQLGPQGAQLAEQLFAALRESLASAIADVFLFSVIVIGVALVATLFLRERPLRSTRGGPPVGGV